MTDDVMVREAKDGRSAGDRGHLQRGTGHDVSHMEGATHLGGRREVWLTGKRAGRFPGAGRQRFFGLLGFATCGPFRAWPGYARTVEHSIHVRAEARGQGSGPCCCPPWRIRCARCRPTSWWRESTPPTRGPFDSTGVLASSKWRGCQRSDSCAAMAGPRPRAEDPYPLTRTGSGRLRSSELSRPERWWPGSRCRPGRTR